MEATPTGRQLDEEFIMLWENLEMADRTRDPQTVKVCAHHALDHFQKMAGILAAAEKLPITLDNLVTLARRRSGVSTQLGPLPNIQLARAEACAHPRIHLPVHNGCT